MRKPYVAHEVLYRKMRAEGVGCWEERNDAKVYERDGPIEQNALRFLVDALAQEWSPRKGRAIELGCGTGPILRWLRERGFGGLGVDVSKTAIAMAREQSAGLGLRFRCADVCERPVARAGAFDLAVDGHCLHCITQADDRQRFLRHVHAMLREGGVLLVLSMCQPVEREAMARMYPTTPLIGSTVYAPVAMAGEYLHSRTIRGKLHMPTRHIGRWRRILGEIREAGFRPRLTRLNECTQKDPVSSVCVAAVR